MKRWGFDIAYTGVYAHTRQQVFDTYRERYIGFADEAHRSGYPACVQVQVTVAPSPEVALTEAQYHRDDRAHVLNDSSFFASFASEVWTRYLEELTAVFFKQYRYDWVVFEEPMFAVDVPGPSDRFAGKFAQAHPGVDLPTTGTDSKSYRLVQDLKSEILTGFLSRLMISAKSAGASKASVMPWFFIPTIENTPAETLNTSCDIGQIVGLDELDFVVVRMQPDNIRANVMRTGDETQQSPLLYYPEVLAHQLGKPVVAVNNPCDEHVPDPSCPLLPLDFFRRASLASFAAAPGGMTRHWYGYQYASESAHMDFYKGLLRYTNRLGSPEASIAYVFSHSGARHGAPYPYEQIWRRWWAFGKEMLLERLNPVRLLWASDLERELAASPELRLLVLSSCFPLTEQQMGVVQEWLARSDGRGVAVFAESPQLSADPGRPGHVPLEESFPGLHQMLGLPWPDALSDESGKLLLAMDPGAVDSFAHHTGLAKDLEPFERIRSQNGAAQSGKAGSTIVVFPWGAIDSPAGLCRFVRGIAAHCGAGPPVVSQASLSVLWNQTGCGYVVITNPAHTPAEAYVRQGDHTIWDVVARRFCSSQLLRIAPFGFRLVRLLKGGDPFLDSDGQMALRNVGWNGSASTLEIIASKAVVLRTLTRVSSVLVDGSAVEFSEHPRRQHWETHIPTPRLADCQVELRY